MDIKKNLLLLTTLFLSGFTLIAQQMNGTYKNDTDSIAFSDESVMFRISGFGGLTSAHAGEGTYEIDGNYLFIHAKEFTGDKSSAVTREGERKDTCEVQVFTPQNYSAQGILVESRNKSGKVISGKVTENDGRVLFSPCDKIVSISASSLGYNAISFDYISGKDFRVRLAQDDIIENRTAVFKINFTDEETLSLLMLTDNFQPGKNEEKELQKLEKRVRKSNKLDKRLKKVYVPYRSRN